MNCPHCGAPPPAGFIIPQGQFSYRCIYCNQSSVQGQAQASVAPQAPSTGPIYIVHHYGNDDDDDDDDEPYHYVPPVVVHAHRPWLIWMIVVILVSVGGGGAGFARWRRGSVGAQILNGMSAGWNGSEPLVCGGNDDIQVSGITATFNAGFAIQANGNCHVRCTDCTLGAPTAIDAGGNAEVIIMNGTISGTPTLATASGNAHVTIAGNVNASGSTKQSGNASISAPTPPPTAKPAPAPAPSPAPSSTAAKKPGAKKR
jgi:hypothetical protein